MAEPKRQTRAAWRARARGESNQGPPVMPNMQQKVDDWSTRSGIKNRTDGAEVKAARAEVARLRTSDDTVEIEREPGRG
jgi:hypothetical protein